MGLGPKSVWIGLSNWKSWGSFGDVRDSQFRLSVEVSFYEQNSISRMWDGSKISSRLGLPGYRNLIVSQNKGTQCRPQYTIILIMGTPKMVPLILGNPH